MIENWIYDSERLNNSMKLKMTLKRANYKSFHYAKSLLNHIYNEGKLTNIFFHKNTSNDKLNDHKS